jgi:chromosome segregation ATPase
MKEVTRLLDEIRSVDVEWPVVLPSDDEHGGRVERLQREEERLAAELRAMEGERQELEGEQESVEAQKLEAAPYQEDVAELKAEIRRLQGVVANEALAQETVDLLTEEQELLATQLEQAEHRSHVLVAKAEELASLIMEEAEGGGALGQDSLEVELKRVLAEAEAAHDTVDACKAAAAEQKQSLARSQLELVEAKEEAQQAQVELKDGHHELLIASQEAADMVNAVRKRQEDLSLRCGPARRRCRCDCALIDVFAQRSDRDTSCCLGCPGWMSFRTGSCK